MSEKSKLVGHNAFLLLQHLYDRANGDADSAVSLSQADSDALNIPFLDLLDAKEELEKSKFAQASLGGEGEWSVRLTEEGLDAARRHHEVGEAIDRLRTKAITLPPEMREEFESIVAEVHQKLRQRPHNRADLKVLIASLAEMFESHVPEIATLLSQIGL